MSEPLDFTSAGRERLAPQQQTTPGLPSSVRRGPGPMSFVVAAVVVVALGAVLGFHFLGRSGKSSAGSAQHVGRYCQLAQQFDQLTPTDKSPGAVNRFLQAMGDTTAEMEADAPPAIRSDVAAVVSAWDRAGTGNVTVVNSQSFGAARGRISTFRAKMCPNGSGSNDQ